MQPTDPSFPRRAFGALVAALVWPLPTRFGSALALDLAGEPLGTRPWTRAVYGAGLVVFPVLFAAFAALLVVDRDRYVELVTEDGVVEWATVAGLAVAAALAAANAASERRARRSPNARMAFLGLGVLCALVALEEISWGQRLFAIENPEFFVAYSDQKEINVHNVVQKVTHVAMKWPVGLGYVIYGALLPLVAFASRSTATGRGGAMVRRLEGWGVPVPPLSLVRGFLLGSLLMIDLPTYDEEEIAELFGVLALVLILLGERVRHPSA